MSRLRAAIVGVGFVGAQHLEAVRRLGDVDVALLAASTPDRAADLAARFAVPRSTGRWDEVVADPDVDVVHVCVPNDVHHAVVSASLASGKHVICEKPLARTIVEGEDLVRSARGSDRVTVLCHNYRFFPMAAELRSRVAAGELGTVHNVRGSYLQDWLLDPTATNWRIDAMRGGASRTIADIGSHWVDLAEFVTGRRLEAAFAQIGTVHARRPHYAHRLTFAAQADGEGAPEGDWLDVATEDQAAVLLRFEGGLHGSVVLSQVAAGHKNALELAIDGSTGSAVWRQERPDELIISHRAGATEVVARDPATLSASAATLARLPAGHNEGWADGLRNLFAAAYDEIRGVATAADRERLPTFDDGLRHLRFVGAALASARDGRWVGVAPANTRTT